MIEKSGSQSRDETNVKNTQNHNRSTEETKIVKQHTNIICSYHKNTFALKKLQKHAKNHKIV